MTAWVGTKAGLAFRVGGADRELALSCFGHPPGDGGIDQVDS